MADGEATCSTIFEMQMGMVDRGADLSWLSQYPHEREILFGPLTGIEVLRTRIDGTVVVIECAFSINLTALTLEQLLTKRHKLVKDTLSSMVLEMRMQSGDESADSLKGALDAGVFSDRVPEDFNNDATYSEAIRKANSIKASILNKKFVDDYTATEMAFGQQDEFFKGLEGLIGPPNPDLVKGIRGEHCERTDSRWPFRTSNYGIETTSRASMVRLPSLTAGRPATDRSRSPFTYSGLQWAREESSLCRTDTKQRPLKCSLVALSKRLRRLFDRQARRVPDRGRSRLAQRAIVRGGRPLAALPS